MVASEQPDLNKSWSLGQVDIEDDALGSTLRSMRDTKPTQRSFYVCPFWL